MINKTKLVLISISLILIIFSSLLATSKTVPIINVLPKGNINNSDFLDGYDSTAFVLRNDWTTINNYPAACAAGEYVSAIGDTLTCSTPAGGAGGSNSTYNATYDRWAYNQTTAGSSFNYNQTTGTYNLYGMWWYNQSTGSFNQYGGNWYNHTSAVNTLYGKWFYNETIAANTSIYNAYSRWWYNQTYSGSIYNSTYNTWAYNQSTGTFNQYGLWWYNHTSASNTSIFNTYDNRWSSAYNITYAQWAYNQTTSANSYTDTRVGVGNLHTHNASNITAGTFGAGNFVFQTNATVENLVMETSGYITSNSTCTIIKNGGTELAICQ